MKIEHGDVVGGSTIQTPSGLPQGMVYEDIDGDIVYRTDGGSLYLSGDAVGEVEEYMDEYIVVATYPDAILKLGRRVPT